MSARRRPEPGTAGHRLLEAGRDLLDESDALTTVTGSGLSIVAVARAARTTRATFYAYWPTIDDYLVDLVGYLLEDGGARTEESALRDAVELGSMSIGLLDVLREVAARDLRLHVSSRSDRRRLALAAQADDPRAVGQVRDAYGRVDARQRGSFEAILSRWGREPRPPFTTDELLVVHDALLDGFTLRNAVDPERATPELYATADIAFELVLSRAVGDTETIDDLLAQFDRVPEPPGPAEPGVGLGRIDPAVVGSRVVRAVARILLTESWPNLTVDEIAAAAQLAPVEVVSTCGSKASVGALTASHLVSERLARITTELDALDPIDRVRRILAECRATYRTYPALAQATMQVLTGLAPASQPGTATWWPSIAIASSLVAAHETGMIRPDLDPTGLAEALARAVICDVVAAFPARGVPVDSADLLLEGSLAHGTDAGPQ